ncbi:uncharacterized protein C11orf24-like [Polyergus mexicanus]|uniref:uncharacterized protein C11orf24-like n=1 Tax=Polyergus mexicanus TaxID=615972 RepID=UPI0038B5DC56
MKPTKLRQTRSTTSLPDHRAAGLSGTATVTMPPRPTAAEARTATATTATARAATGGAVSAVSTMAGPTAAGARTGTAATATAATATTATTATSPFQRGQSTTSLPDHRAAKQWYQRRVLMPPRPTAAEARTATATTATARAATGGAVSAVSTMAGPTAAGARTGTAATATAATATTATTATSPFQRGQFLSERERKERKRKIGATSPSPGVKRPCSGVSSPSPGVKRPSSGASSPSSGAKGPSSGVSSTQPGAPLSKPRIIRIISGDHQPRLQVQRRNSHPGRTDVGPTWQRSKEAPRREPSPATGATSKIRSTSPIIISSSDESHGRPKTPQPRESSPDGPVPWWLPTWAFPVSHSVETQTEELPAKGTQGTQTHERSAECRDQATQIRKRGGQQRYVPINYFSRQGNYM